MLFEITTLPNSGMNLYESFRIIRTIDNLTYLINKGHNLALIANYLVREHAETVGETTKQLTDNTYRVAA